jgi:hypothetical protein
MVCLLPILANHIAQAQQVPDNDLLNWEDAFLETRTVPKSNSYAPYGGVFTPKGTLKCMIIYAGFYNENNPNVDNQDLTNWPNNGDHTSVPFFAQDGDASEVLFKNASDLTNPQYANIANITRFYYEMSHGQFIMLGNVFSDPTTGTPVRVNVDPTGCTSWSSINKRVLEKAKLLYPNFDWSPYDSRTNYPSYQYDNSLSTPDSLPDYVIIAYRYSNGWNTWLFRSDRATLFGQIVPL